jgi:hypothetical protein
MGIILEYQTPIPNQRPANRILGDVVIGGLVQLTSVFVVCSAISGDIEHFCFCVAVGYWVGVFCVGIRRGRAPSWLDHAYLMFGFSVLLLLSLIAPWLYGMQS